MIDGLEGGKYLNYNIDSEFENSLFVVDLDTLTCLYCDELFFKYVCQKFMESTNYEDSIEILSYFIEEENEYAWDGFPIYLKKITHSELFEVLNCSLNCSGIKASPFQVGDLIHPMFLEIVKQCGIKIDEKRTMVENKNSHVALVNKEKNILRIYHSDMEVNNIANFLDTMELIDSSIKLCSAVDYSKKHTHIYWEDEYPTYSLLQTTTIDISVVNEKTIMSAIKNRKKYPGYKIAVLNFANPVNPGGGVKNGFMGQEEELCRCSTLYKIISDNSVCGKYYEHHKNCSSSISTDSLIYSEDIIILKSDEKEPVRMDSKEYISIDVITMAAPCCGKDMGTDAIDDETLYEIHIQRARHMLTVAAHKEVEVLILGAFGCGAFKNNPIVVAKAYSKVMKEFSNCFKYIEFAIYSGSEEKNSNYEIFKAEINNTDC